MEWRDERKRWPSRGKGKNKTKNKNKDVTADRAADLRRTWTHHLVRSHRGLWGCCETTPSPGGSSGCSCPGPPVSPSRPPTPCRPAAADRGRRCWSQCPTGSTARPALPPGGRRGVQIPTGWHFQGYGAQSFRRSVGSRTWCILMQDVSGQNQGQGVKWKEYFTYTDPNWPLYDFTLKLKKNKQNHILTWDYREKNWKIVLPETVKWTVS